MPKTFDQYRDDLAADSQTETQDAPVEGALGGLTNAELRELADQHGIDVSGMKKKADLVDALEAAGVTSPGE